MSSSIPELTQETRSGVVNIVLENSGQRVGSGTGFLTDAGLITASHVIREHRFDTAMLALDGGGAGEPIRLSEADMLSKIVRESPKEQHDFAVLDIDEPEFEGRHRLKLAGLGGLRVGEQVLFLGYPYDSQNLTAHVGYVSSIHSSGNTRVLQLDGSVNPSNSGGPVLDTNTGDVVAYVTRAQTGLMTDFDALVEALEGNVSALSQQRSGQVIIAGIDPVASLRVTMVAMRQLAVNMRRSANVGIGYAYDAAHILEALN